MNGTKMSSGISLEGSRESWWFLPSFQSTMLPVPELLSFRLNLAKH